MGGGGGQSTQSSGSSHEVKTISLPAWVEAASQKNYGIAEEIADRPLVRATRTTSGPSSTPAPCTASTG